MEQALGALGLEPDLQPLKLPASEPQGGSALGIGDATSERRLDQAGARHFLPAHRECLHGVTFSRSS
jgi:hypothetical protein